ncbi:hypothetical protein SAMN05443634_11031 [Chishuiella changwenlii]|uniref:HTH cro/C1-type domain-containing protein n=1 Tax=Chishuiella changwenlii TaxID=1434701 RepID=A0A1M7B3F0_9FLAO|nr:helix-turn-helix transcriptional regulator [Chishuiella changwenlii]GGE95736.1 hypothetical protein GCM10010984_11540 [Chishuiella changwenlii]SHL49457.1 hypothetical protein SAMN05443634_11031 [Chishuiella changwenlii]
MSNINDRIKDLVLFFANGNNSLFASKLGISEANVRNYISKTEPKFNILEKIANNFEINFEWLLTGKGEMLKQESEIVNLEKNSFENLSIEEKLKAIFIQNKALKEKIDNVSTSNKQALLEVENRIFGDVKKNMKKFTLQDIYLLIEDVETKQETQHDIFNNILAESKILEFLKSLETNEHNIDPTKTFTK